jgi:hypothetical protein
MRCCRAVLGRCHPSSRAEFGLGQWPNAASPDLGRHRSIHECPFGVPRMVSCCRQESGDGSIASGGVGNQAYGATSVGANDRYDNGVV